MSSFDWAGRRRTVFVRLVTDLATGIGLFAAGEFLEFFELVEIKFSLVQVRLSSANQAQTRKAINEKRQNAPYTSKTTAIILRPWPA